MHARNGCKVTNCMGLAVERSDQKCREGLVAVCSITIYLKEKKRGRQRNSEAEEPHLYAD